MGAAMRRVLTQGGGLAAALALLGLVVLGWASPASAERRVALVIGNAAYPKSALRNPVQDATKVSEVLRQLDFDVLLATDLDKQGMEQTLRRFKGMLPGADVALFYYSGHAIQAENRNFLLPVSASPDDLTITLDAVALQDVSNIIKQAGVKVELLFLDACRNNPYADSGAVATRGTGAARGLARISSSLGSLVVFSTSPGSVAYDGTGELSPFTAAFVRHAMTPRLEVRQVLTRVRADVTSETEQKQIPWDNSSLVGDFFLVPKRPPPVVEKVAMVVLPEEGSQWPLGLKAPVQPEGGALKATVSPAPKAGRLVIDGKALAEGDTVPGGDVPRLAYAATSSAPDAFGLRVEDSWGNSETALVSIVHQTGARPAAPVPVADIGRIDGKGISLVGLGANLVFTSAPQVPPSAAGVRVRLASNLPFGQLLLGDRIIETGKTIDASDLPRLAFLSPPGQGGKSLEATFEAVEPARGQARLAVDIKVTDCDRLAGSVLDPQGVTEGVLTGKIDTAQAFAACDAAVKAKPQVARFQFELGRVLLAMGRSDEALSRFQTAADLGHVRARQTVGYMYALGAGIPTDFERGRAELEKAAAAGDIFAVHTLGAFAYDGRGMKQDFALAKERFEQAARAGHTYSMNALGRMYQRGEGVPVDLEMTRRYWEASADRGDLYGIHNLGYVYLDGIGVPKDPAKALELFRKASDLGHPGAPNSIGRMYVLGLGVAADLAQGRAWYKIGADRGDGWAAYNLAELARLGKGGKTDLVEAATFYARAAAYSNVEAAGNGVKALASLDRKVKAQALRAMLAASGSPDVSEAQLVQAARALAQTKKVQLSADTLDAAMVAVAQVQFLASNVRADLF
jgi:TPR repeat protein